MRSAGDHAVRLMRRYAHATTTRCLAPPDATNSAPTVVDRADRRRDPRGSAQGGARTVQGGGPVRPFAHPRPLSCDIGVFRGAGEPSCGPGPHTFNPRDTDAQGTRHHRRPQPGGRQGLAGHWDRLHCRLAPRPCAPGCGPVRTLRPRPFNQYVGRVENEVSGWSRGSKHHCRRRHSDNRSYRRRGREGAHRSWISTGLDCCDRGNHTSSVRQPSNIAMSHGKKPLGGLRSETRSDAPTRRSHGNCRQRSEQ